jgi:hypothetical protein
MAELLRHGLRTQQLAAPSARNDLRAGAIA